MRDSIGGFSKLKVDNVIGLAKVAKIDDPVKEGHKRDGRNPC